MRQGKVRPSHLKACTWVVDISEVELDGSWAGASVAHQLPCALDNTNCNCGCLHEEAIARRGHTPEFNVIRMCQGPDGIEQLLHAAGDWHWPRLRYKMISQADDIFNIIIDRTTVLSSDAPMCTLSRHHNSIQFKTNK